MSKEVRSLVIVFLLSILAMGTGFAADQEIGAKASQKKMVVEYKGPLISDTLIPGEGKSDGITPEISSCVQASRDK